MRIRKAPENRKEEILNSALRLFAERGYPNLGMADIGKETSLARSSLYEYFASKDEIALCLLAKLTEPFQSIKIRGKKIEKKLTNLLEDIFQIALEKSVLLDLYFHAYPSLSQANRSQSAEWQKIMMGMLANIFQDEKKLRFSPSVAAYLSLSIVLQRLTDMVFSKSAINPADEAEVIAAFILKGIG
ncbi:MAG: helix-turn-helix domain-containing protein [Anaerolineaceae bacterium]|nr:helix-turn-helix domain-containing protein [Anaerolineaceae bacterium]